MFIIEPAKKRRQQLLRFIYNDYPITRKHISAEFGWSKGKMGSALEILIKEKRICWTKANGRYSYYPISMAKELGINKGKPAPFWRITENPGPVRTTYY